MKLLSTLLLLLTGMIAGTRGHQERDHGTAGHKPEEWSPALASAYTALIHVRNAELQAHWARYNIQAALNLGFVIGTLGARQDSFIGQHHVLVAGIGICLGIVWLWFAVESKNTLTGRWDRHVRKFEGLHRAQLSYHLLTDVEDEEKNRWAGPLTVVQCLLPAAFIAGWSAYLIGVLCVCV